MATYPPPSFFSNIFDTNAFSHGNDNAGLTEAEADLLYFKYPLGQAFETLQQTDHTGLATFNAGIDINTGTLKFPDNTVQTTAAGSGGGETLAQTLLLGNSAGATDINMNNNDITNCATVSGLQLSTGVLANNINIGTPNLNLTTTGDGHNIAIGDNIMKFITNAKYNTMCGSATGQALVSGQGNEGYGSSALQNNQTGSFNVAVGNRAGEKNLGSYNVFIGAQAGQNGAVASTQNTFVGQGAGQADTGSNNSYLGCGTSIGGGVSNSTVIGYLATTSTANTIQLGTTSQNVNCPHTLSVASTTNMSNNLSMNSITAIANRQISSSYYNFYATNNVATLTYSGRFYGNLNAIVYDCPDTSSTGSSSHIFYNYNNASVLNSLTISNTGITNNTVQPASNNSSTIVPTTAWVQSAISAYVPSGGSATTLAQIGGYNSATGLAFPSTVNITVPANAVYADIFLAGVGGGAGFGGDRSAGGYYTGGAGGGATATYGRVFCKGLALSVFQASNQVCLSVGGITVVKVWNGSQGGSASASAGGVGGVANSNATVISVSGYSSWFSYNGGAGANGGTNNAPASVGTILLTGYNASTLLGCGQSISTSGGGNPYAFQTTYFGGAYITYYTI